MSTEYTKTNWQDGDIITADKMNNIENGVKGIEEDVATVKDGFDDLDDRVTALEQGSGSGLTDDIKQALLQIAMKVAYVDEHGQDYYDDLYDALYPPADLVSISAVYTQSGTVHDSDTLDSLKADLVVTAHMSDHTTRTVTDYTLSGTLAEGTSMVTVTYGGKTTTFNVTVTGIDYLYRLPTETTFNGTSDFIDTELQLYATDIDFTILGNAQFARSANSYNVLMHCMHEANPWNGSLIDHPSTGLRFAWGSGGYSSLFGNTYPLDIKFAITHEQGSNSYTVRVKNLGTNEEGTSDVSWTFASISESVILGAYQNTYGTKGRYFTGTIYDFAIIDGVMESDYITRYFE